MRTALHALTDELRRLKTSGVKTVAVSDESVAMLRRIVQARARGGAAAAPRDMPEPAAFRGNHRFQGADLIERQAVNGIGIQAQFAASENGPVVIGRMRTDRNPEFQAEQNGFPHPRRGSGMETAGNAGRGNERHHRRIQIRVQFTEVGIDVDRKVHACHHCAMCCRHCR